MLPQATPTQSGWDPEILKQAERELARVVGPVASVMVKRAAATATDVGILYGILAEYLADNDRAAFLQTSAPSSSPTPSPPAPLQLAASAWDPEILREVEHQLAHLVGPIARSMVRRAAAETIDIDKLYLALADQLTGPDQRAWLHETAPAAVPAAEVAQEGAHAAAILKHVEQRLVGFVDPIAKSLAGRYAAGTNALHNAYHSLTDKLARKHLPATPQAPAAELAQPEVLPATTQTAAPELPQPEVPKEIDAPQLYPVVAPKPKPAEKRTALLARRDRLRGLPSRARRSTVSRLLTGRERLQVRLSPAEVVAGGRSIVCDPALGAEPWQGAVATLKAFEWTERCEVTAVLSNHFVRYAVVPWSDALSNAAEEDAYLRHHFAKIHGERAKAWTTRASEDRRGVPRLASAIDTALLEGLKGAFPRGGKASLVSVQPELMEAINRWRDAIPREGAWLVLAEPERACLAVYKDGGWRSVQNAKGDWLTLLERERLRLHGGLHDVPELVLLSGAPAPKEIQGWQFRELEA